MYRFVLLGHWLHAFKVVMLLNGIIIFSLGLFSLELFLQGFG